MTTTTNAPLGTMSNQVGITSTRHALAAAQAASGIAFVSDDRASVATNATWLCAAVDSELAHSLESMGKRAGPHQSAKSRSISATLLIPTATPQGHPSNVHYVNAFAAMVAHRPEKGGRVDDSSAETGRQKRPLTTRVRFNLAFGKDDVADILSFWNLKSGSGFDWKLHPSIVFSFLDGKTQTNVIYKLDGRAESPNLAFGELQARCGQAQQLSNACLTLPASMLDATLASTIVCTSDALERLQIEIQTEIRELFCPTVAVSPSCGASPNFCQPWGDLERDFVRVVTPCAFGAILHPEHPAHCRGPGILLTQEKGVEDWDRSLTDSYVRRCSKASRLDEMTHQWHLYILDHPVEEEVNAGVSVLWFPVERTWIGAHLSCFGIRSIPGDPVTCYQDSCIVRVHPRVQPISELLNNRDDPKWVLPATPESVIRGRGCRFEAPGSPIHAMNAAFCKRMTTSLAEVLDSPNGASSQPTQPMGVATSPATTATDPAAVREEMALLALMQAIPGSRTSTVGDVYAHMGADSDIFTMGTMAGFHAILSTAVKAGRSREPLKRIFDEAAELMDAKKRPKTPNAHPDATGLTSVASAESVASAASTVSTVNAHGNEPSNTQDILATPTNDPTAYLLNSSAMSFLMPSAGMMPLTTEGGIPLPKRCDVPGSQRILSVLAAVDPSLGCLDVATLSTPSSAPKSAAWIDFLLEVINKSIALRECTHLCAAEPLAASNKGNPPSVFELSNGTKRQVTSLHLLRQPASPSQLTFYFEVNEQRLFTLFIYVHAREQ